MKDFIKKIKEYAFFVLMGFAPFYAFLLESEAFGNNAHAPLLVKIISVFSAAAMMLIVGARWRQVIEEAPIFSVVGTIFRLILHLLASVLFFALCGWAMITIFGGGSWSLWILVFLGMMAVAFIPLDQKNNS